MARENPRGRIARAADAAGARINTVGMSQRELDSLLSDLDAPKASDPKRVFSRWRYRDPSLEIRFRHKGGNEITMRIACRNLSCGGAAVLHNAYVHLDTPCTLMLPRRGSQPLAVEGRVVRCQHRQGVVHELGVRFNQPIRVRDFCGAGPLIDRFSFERVEPHMVQGTLLVVSGSELQHRLLQSFLRDTGVKLRFARSCADAMNESLGSVDLVIADWKLPDGDGHALLMDLRSAGSTAPVIMVIPGEMDISGRSDGVAPEAYLRLPLREEDVLRALAEFLLMPGERAAGAQGEGTAQQVAEAVASLRIAAAAGDGIGCYSVCTHLRELGESAGMGQVAKLATQAALALGESLNLPKARPHINALLAACQGLAGASDTAA